MHIIYNASNLAKEEVGYVFELNHIIDINELSDLCFRPLYSELKAKFIFKWKNYSSFFKATQVFLKNLNRSSRTGN